MQACKRHGEHPSRRTKSTRPSLPPSNLASCRPINSLQRAAGASPLSMCDGLLARDTNQPLSGRGRASRGSQRPSGRSSRGPYQFREDEGSPRQRLGLWIGSRLLLMDVGTFACRLFALIGQSGGLFMRSPKSGAKPLIVRNNGPGRGQAIALHGQRFARSCRT
jgi:hypothetical protein